MNIREADYQEGFKPIVPDEFTPLWNRLRELAEHPNTLETLEGGARLLFEARKDRFKNFEIRTRPDKISPILDIKMSFEDRGMPTYIVGRIWKDLILVQTMSQGDMSQYKFTRMDEALWWIFSYNGWGLPWVISKSSQ